MENKITNNDVKEKVIITRGIVVLPFTNKLIEVGREKSITTIKKSKVGDNIVVVSQQKPEIDNPELTEIYVYGTLCEILEITKISEDDYNITLKGLSVVQLSNLTHAKASGYSANITPVKIKKGLAKKNAQLINYIMSIIEENTINKNGELNLLKEYISDKNEDYDLITNFVVNSLIEDTSNKIELERLQEYLEADSLTKKLELTFGILVEHFDELSGSNIKTQVDSEINKKLNESMSKQQKEYYLREKLRVVKEELGEISNREDDADKIRKRVNENPYPDHIREKILIELSKYEAAMSSNESSIIKNYIDWLLDLPWWQESKDNADIINVDKVLNENHYGIAKVKERILEFLALSAKNPNVKSPILCLVGPPGVGKTSLAKSIAEALNKTFVKVSLGGVRDEAEIRGHRKTYIGAMPGRIIKGMKKAKVLNPLFLLDELDKMASDQRGDPASAMLEVLDPEQNSKFSDNYIEEEYNLSKVLFIATANYYKQIPAALIDRLEVIELSSYTLPEKLEIAKQHLIPEVMKDTLVDSKNLVWEDEAIRFIINHYTYEAGVRELQRQIQKIMRKFVVQELKKEALPPVINVDAVKKYLGRIIFDIEMSEDSPIPGIVNGMAYTSAGGDLLPIECTFAPGKGKIIITGNLEQTMTESVNVALNYVRANAKAFNVENIDFNEIDIHIHVPAGGVPKDGPSAGVAVTSAIISKLTNKSVSSKISMTGEITLRGKVGIIGGVKEKVISAHRAGVREIFIPIEDERFLEDIPNYILDDVKIHLIKQYSEIYSHLFK